MSAANLFAIPTAYASGSQSTLSSLAGTAESLGLLPGSSTSADGNPLANTSFSAVLSNLLGLPTTEPVDDLGLQLPINVEQAALLNGSKLVSEILTAQAGSSEQSIDPALLQALQNALGSVSTGEGETANATSSLEQLLAKFNASNRLDATVDSKIISVVDNLQSASPQIALESAETIEQVIPTSSEAGQTQSVANPGLENILEEVGANPVSKTVSENTIESPEHKQRPVNAISSSTSGEATESLQTQLSNAKALDAIGEIGPAGLVATITDPQGVQVVTLTPDGAQSSRLPSSPVSTQPSLSGLHALFAAAQRESSDQIPASTTIFEVESQAAQLGVSGPVQLAAQSRSANAFQLGLQSLGEIDSDRSAISENNSSLAPESLGNLLKPAQSTVQAIVNRSHIGELYPNPITAHGRIVTREGRPEIEIFLDPPELGSIRIQLRGSEEGFIIRIIAADSAVKDVLQGQLDELQESFEAAGLELADCGVDCEEHLPGGEEYGDGLAFGTEDALSSNTFTAHTLSSELSIQQFLIQGRVDLLA